MAKKRTNKKKKHTKRTASKIDLTVVGLIILSLLLVVLIYGKSGVIGIKLNEILGGMMGIIRYVLPIGIFAIAIKLACADNEYLSSKLTQYAILLISFTVLLGLYQINKGELTIDKELSDIVKDAYAIGARRKRRRSIRSIISSASCKSFRRNWGNNINFRHCNNVTSIYIWYKYVRNYK